MSTRLYLPRLDEHWVIPDYSSEWDGTTDAVRRLLLPAPTGPGGEQTFTATETAAGEVNVLVAQYTSYALAEQTIDGTAVGYAQTSSSGADADMRSQVRVLVVSGDGTTVRGVLLDVDDATALTSEWGTAQEVRRFPVAGSTTTLTSVDAQAGDRLVVEVGARSHNALTASRAAELLLGTFDLATDVPASEGSSADTRPWVELSADLVFAAPPGDDFENAVSLAASGALTLDTEGASVEVDEPLIGYQFWEEDPDNLSEPIWSVWWTWTAPGDGPVSFDSTGSTLLPGGDAFLVLSAYTGTEVDALTLVAENEYVETGTTQAVLTFEATSATTYLIRAASYATEYATVELAWEQVGAGGPVNDAYAGAIDLDPPAGGTIAGTNVDAGVQAGEPVIGYASVWYSWWVPARATPGEATLTITSVADLVIAVFEGGDPVGSLTTVASSTDGSVSWTPDTGAGPVNFAIRISGVTALDEATFDLTWSHPPVTAPANDNFADAQQLTGDAGTVPGANVGATVETGETAYWVRAGVVFSSVWYAWTAPGNGTLSLAVTGVDAGRTLVLDVWTETYWAGEAEGNAPTLTFGVWEAFEYFIRVSSATGEYVNVSDFDLAWTFTAGSDGDPDDTPALAEGRHYAGTFV